MIAAPIMGGLTFATVVFACSLRVAAQAWRW